MVKRLPASWETRVQSPGREDSPVLLSGKFHGLRNLVSYSPWGRKEWDTAEQLHFHFQVALVVKNLPANTEDMRYRFDPWVGKITWRRVKQPTPVFLAGESHKQKSLEKYSS